LTFFAAKLLLSKSDVGSQNVLFYDGLHQLMKMILKLVRSWIGILRIHQRNRKL